MFSDTPAPTRATFRFAFDGPHPDARRAFEIQRERAAMHGQVWTERHAHALQELQQAYVLTGRGFTQGQVAWPLAVGVGKTESLVTFVRAQYERFLIGQAPLTLLVCMERVSQLSDLYREIIKTGVPPEFVAIHHRKSAEEIEGERLVQPVPLDATSRYPVLLATHSLMLRGEANIAALNRYRDGERSLVVWDESLLKSQGHFLDLTTVAAACNTLGGFAHGFTEGPPNEDARDAHAFIQARLGVLREVFDRQLKGASIEIVQPPEVSPEDETRFLAGLASVLDRRDLGSLPDTLREFLDHTQRPLRVVPFIDGGQKVGIIHYETLIPKSLYRLIVLDASHNIRLLTSKHDTTLAVTPVDCAVKSFEHVTVRHLKVGAGRNALAQSLPRRNSALMREVVEEVKSWPADEAGIIFTFKHRVCDQRAGRLPHADYIRNAMRAAGIDSAATVMDGKLGLRPRFVFITWGKHTGTSSYAYCKRVLLVGVQRRHRLDLSAAIVGQRADLNAPQAADPEEIKRVELSECFHNIVQAAGRGACRTTMGGKASPMEVALICSDTFPAGWWKAAMPGAAVEAWRAKHARPARLSEDRREAIKIALQRLPKDQSSVSTFTLRTLSSLDGLSKSAYQKTLAAVAVEGWRHEGRSFVRVSPFD